MSDYDRGKFYGKKKFQSQSQRVCLHVNVFSNTYIYYVIPFCFCRIILVILEVGFLTVKALTTNPVRGSH